jgi:glutamine synthetase
VFWNLNTQSTKSNRSIKEMAAQKLEYIWLDGYQPEPSIRSKTKIVHIDGEITLDQCSQWSFDGSSTEQAEGGSSDCLLKPVKIVPDSDRKDAWLVLCEVLNADGSVHPSNARSAYDDDPDMWFGFEQEYTLIDPETHRPLGFPHGGYPGPQGPYYCSVGTGKTVGREIIEEHLDACLHAGLGITGVNAEVMMGQWEYQLMGKGSRESADSVWLSRYLLHRTAEKYGVLVDLHPKPITGDWNGSGMHANFSNTFIRETGGEEAIREICEKFRPVHKEHIAVYGSSNEMRLTGMHETQSIDQFSYGVSDRGASIRIPVGTVNDGWKGYLEDRRPASNADPYKVAGRICQTVNS